MSEQTSLFPELKQDNPLPEYTEKQAKADAANLLQTLLEAGFVNVHKEDISDEHLKKLITKLQED